MSIAIVSISILAGICAWGLLLAGALTFHDPDRPVISGWGVLLFFADIFISLGLFTMVFIIVRNWSRKPEARRLLYAGFSCLAFAVVMGVVGFRLG
ncbi:MAG TPA: hypothetical protein VEC99_03185 [Clostridia bacterium]|nr:hypothetical protein [Clostridia bacterium]